jgi:twitching motility two-component system response regulator PilH
MFEVHVLGVGDAFSELAVPASLVLEHDGERLAIIKREEPDLILLDVVMPTMHGDKALQALSSRGWDSKATVLFYSSRPREELEQLVTTTGADGYIAKDIGFAAMVESVNEWLAKTSASP